MRTTTLVGLGVAAVIGGALLAGAVPAAEPSTVPPKQAATAPATAAATYPAKFPAIPAKEKLKKLDALPERFQGAYVTLGWRGSQVQGVVSSEAFTLVRQR